MLPSEVREDFTGQGKRRPEDRSQRPEIRGHSSGRPRWPAAASRLRVAGSSGLAPCALSHWISFRPVIAGSRPVSLGGRGSLKGRLVLQIVTDIVFIMALKIVNGPAQ